MKSDNPINDWVLNLWAWRKNLDDEGENLSLIG